MKHLFLCLSLFFLCINTVFSQEIHKNVYLLRFKITPLPMIDYTPRFRFGLELLSNKKTGYSIDIGIGNTTLNNFRLDGLIWGNNYKFFEIRPEVKFALKKTNYYTLYGATEFFYLKMTDFLKDKKYQKEHSNIATHYESATFNKQKSGIHLKFGIDFNIYKRFDVDFYGGFGIAERNIRYTHVLNPTDGEDPIFVEWVPQNYLFEGRSVIFHLTCGFKIGYILAKNQI